MKNTFRSILSILLFVLVVAGCSPQQRLTRVLRANPELMETRTIEIDTALIAQKRTIDSAFYMGWFSRKEIRESGMVITLEREANNFTLHVEKQPDTIRFRQTHEYTIVNPETQQAILTQKNWKEWLKRGAIGLIVIVVLVFLIKITDLVKRLL